jgi:hypothetical protein
LVFILGMIAPSALRKARRKRRFRALWEAGPRVMAK